VLSAAPIWWLVALPVLNGQAAPRHLHHFGYVVAHASGGTLMLFVGALGLYVGWSRRGLKFHKWIGYTYLAGGALGAGMGLFLSVLQPHSFLPGVGLATGTLACAWLTVAAMAWRAAYNKRFDSHREWMTRSYVLTWTFVFCRIVMRLPAFAAIDPPTIVGIIWATWITPLIVCEIALQWGRGAKPQRVA
jgi:hypothetical protein